MLVTGPPVEVVENLWMLGTSEYPVYLSRADAGHTVFEGGIGAVGPLLGEQLAALGIDGGQVARIAVTHAHPDHVMALPAFREQFPAAKVLASESAARTLSAQKVVGFFAKMDGLLREALVEQGLLGGQYQAVAPTENLIPVDEILREGDTIGTGPDFRVLETPGHSECSLSFFEPEGRVLIVSDATGHYMPQHGAWWPCYFSDYGAYFASIQRLAGLEAEVLCLSHNGAIRGAGEVADYFRSALEAAEQCHRRIVDEVRAGKPVREIGETLGAEVHVKVPLLPLEFFQKNCGLMVKLSLRHEGIEPENPT